MGVARSIKVPVVRAISRQLLIGGDEGTRYTAVRAWWARHALRASDAGALYPDVVLRRLGDMVEVSWTARPPVQAPDGFRFELTPGAAYLPVGDVAGPLWQAVCWAAEGVPGLSPDERTSLGRLRQRKRWLAEQSVEVLERAYLPGQVFQRVTDARQTIRLPRTARRMAEVPALDRLDDAVLMFGGVTVEFGESDIRCLLDWMAGHVGRRDDPALQEHVDDSLGPPLTAPYEEGYDLAEALLEDLSLPGDGDWIDVRAVAQDLGIDVTEQRLDSPTLRGVALAGTDYGPAILVNRASPYNQSEPGRRFTLAHELFHILYDRTRARRLAHSSGPWASAGVEKRANAFAAMLLMPRTLVRRVLPGTAPNQEAIGRAAADLRVGITALAEHLYNIGEIDEVARDTVRGGGRGIIA